MKTRGQECALAQKKETKKRKINPNKIILAYADLIKKEEGSLRGVNEESLKIVGKHFKLKSENIRKIVKRFQPKVRRKKM